jgi:hypothetical protein
MIVKERIKNMLWAIATMIFGFVCGVGAVWVYNKNSKKVE